jgi:transcriptional regulator with XRE-family HTH domain
MRRSILRNERQQKNLTMKNVSQHVGIEMSHYAKIEHGTSNPSLEVACRLEKFFTYQCAHYLNETEKTTNDI